jgi:hypothetical protein
MRIPRAMESMSCGIIVSSAPHRQWRVQKAAARVQIV